MSSGRGELLIIMKLHPRRFWLLIPLDVSAVTIDMVLDTGALTSSISESTRGMLEGLRLLTPVGRKGQLYRLQNLRIQGQDIADLRVHVSDRVTQVGAMGILGLDFLARFEEIHCHVPSARLRLVYPAGMPDLSS